MALDNTVRKAYETLDSGATGPEAWAAQRLIDLVTDTENPNVG